MIQVQWFSIMDENVKWTAGTLTAFLVLIAVVTMEFESSILNVSESDSYANVTVMKRGSTTGNIRVAVRTVDGTARGKD